MVAVESFKKKEQQQQLSNNNDELTKEVAAMKAQLLVLVGRLDHKQRPLRIGIMAAVAVPSPI